MDLIKQTEQDRGIVELGQERSERLPVRFVLVLEAYLSLMRFNLLLARRDFAPLYNKVRNYPTRKRTASSGSVEAICSAIDMACIWYWKEALCLQRSAATVCLLRKYGVSAHLVIGAQQMPFKAHAWVEVEGRVVNDKHYIGELYATLDRC
ncbi:MAG TPA: lasso peptide biosynthesis B2 protein [Candidatus Sulfotelmatobacter sp.]|nr:lasso peptide biosynthesis B2 protein [Candidatus Sulfotelmatobacter sp.]